MLALEINELGFVYDDGTKALDNINIRIDDGETVGIIGSNGAGKSTLVNHLNGWYLPQSGTVTIKGTILNKKTQETIRKEVGIVFQNPDDQLFTTRIYDDVAFGPKNLGTPAAELEKIIEATMKELQIWHLKDKTPAHVSHGQKRFAAIASILVMNPSILVMDEPTSDLDPHNRRKLINLINSINVTKIIVSHDLDFIMDTCNRTIVLSSGRISADGDSKSILCDQSLLENNGLELPLRLQK